TQTITGTVQPAGTDIHPFNLATNASISIALTETHPSAVPLAIGLGIPVGSGCTLLPGGSVVTLEGPSPQLIGSSTAENLCIAVFDPGGLTVPVDYTLSINITPTASVTARLSIQQLAPVLPTAPIIPSNAPALGSDTVIQTISPTLPTD